ncbi:inorganic pyrophosphatase [Pavlovales sp. CCMP2436]|nr:inorganic pyrophosphatase [Pavlovales sp. CCMP2436]
MAAQAGKPMEYTYGDLLFNYGALPQTWNDPRVKSDVGEAQAHTGDNDPIDAVEVGTLQLRSGEVRKVKVLGAIAMIEGGEVDWKVVVLSVDDPYAERINDIDEVLHNDLATLRN